ncbi:MAG: nucleotidyltransferase domain-containing protein [Deltaproteobacteria bacterium]|nr:nucleotidyltransferase domain-containing protein [Deltaproteobacteria bacterium]
MKKTPFSTITDSIIAVLSEDDRVLFAFLYGSATESGQGNDIDIAVYAAAEVDFHKLSVDLKVALHKRIGLPPDAFDVRVLNGVAEQGDIFGLLYLKNVLSDNRLLIDRNPDARTQFLERYGTRFRECEGLIQEVLA